MQLKPAIPPKPNKIICPSCHVQKDPNEITCRNCGARSCPNAHLLSPDSRICRQCGWQDRNWKPGSMEGTTHTQPPPYMPPPDHEIEMENLCPICKTRKTTPPTEPCAVCGYLVSAQYEPAQPATDMRGPVPLQREKFVVHQQLPGTHDKKLEYICPRCSTKIDPRDGRCPNCGYIGSMQYEIPQPKAHGTTELYHHSAPPVRRESAPRTDYVPPSQVGQERSCPKCGLSVSLDSRICPHCGTYCGPGRSAYRQPIGKSAVEKYRETTSGGYFQPPSRRQAREAGTPSRMPGIPPAEPVPHSEPPRMPGPSPVEPMLRSEPPRMQQAPPPYPFETVTEGAVAGSSARSGGVPIREIEAPRREKKKDKAKEWGYREEKKKFPLGLLMAVIIVAVGLVGMVTFVVIQEFLGGGSPSTPSTPSVTTSTDTTPPDISGIDFSTFSGSSATITWVTDEKSTSQVMICDPEGTCSWTDLNKTLVKEHSVTLSNLQADVDYHITVKSVDNSGNEATHEVEKKFSTSGTTIDTEPPLISDIEATNIIETSATITWKTNENTTEQVEYGTTSAYGTKTTVSSTLTTTHSITLTGLTENTTYHFRVISKDGSDNSTRSDVDRTFTTLAPIPVGSEVGNRAPDFTLQDPVYTSYTLSDLRGKPVIVNFWAMWCGPCKEELPFFDQVYSDRSDEVEMLIINLEEDRAAVETFIDTYGYSFTVLIDETGSVADSYPVNSSLDIPRTFFIDADGIIKYAKKGKFTSASEIETILDDM